MTQSKQSEYFVPKTDTLQLIFLMNTDYSGDFGGPSRGPPPIRNPLGAFQNGVTSATTSIKLTAMSLHLCAVTLLAYTSFVHHIYR